MTGTTLAKQNTVSILQANRGVVPRIGTSKRCLGLGAVEEPARFRQDIRRLTSKKAPRAKTRGLSRLERLDEFSDRARVLGGAG
jgi:hypothetical protein